MNHSTNHSFPGSKNENEASGLLQAFLRKHKSAKTKPGNPIPLRAIPRAELAESGGPAVYRLGHSTVLIRLDGKYFLTDPVFCQRASPLQWVGPERFQRTPISLTNLPPIKAVIVSHDHYDHLDRSAIRALKDKATNFVVPRGVGQRLSDWGVAPSKIKELDWWQSVSLASATLTATPTQHFTGRTLFDRNKTSAASWVIESEQSRVFFGGDSGYFPGFRDIGQRFEGFDLTMLENGAYSRFWPDIHMMPEETLQAHLDLGGRTLLPIHNSTFDLAFHDWFEPMERLHHLAKGVKVSVSTPVFGEPVSPISAAETQTWWRDVSEAYNSTPLSFEQASPTLMTPA